MRGVRLRCEARHVPRYAPRYEARYGPRYVPRYGPRREARYEARYRRDMSRKGVRKVRDMERSTPVAGEYVREDHNDAEEAKDDLCVRLDAGGRGVSEG